ncbi:hypothetical protein EI555_016502 [Monodon monoceros]|uniref:Uncharacterized protein n=1 Tax=Monodon monoceros TaxID=40151 RepID=A0A4V5PA40_MONMO|nr:hypothetical protein EI555_016502 [Monodon monoceros]
MKMQMPRGPVQRLPSPAGGGEVRAQAGARGGAVSPQDTGEICFPGQVHEWMLPRAAENCQSHSSLKGSEGGVCHTEGLTRIFPKNEKSFTIIYGHRKKTEKKKAS